MTRGCLVSPAEESPIAADQGLNGQAVWLSDIGEKFDGYSCVSERSFSALLQIGWVTGKGSRGGVNGILMFRAIVHGWRSWALVYRPGLCSSSSATAYTLHRKRICRRQYWWAPPGIFVILLLFLAAWSRDRGCRDGRVSFSGRVWSLSPFKTSGPERPRANATDILRPHAMNHTRAGLGLIS